MSGFRPDTAGVDAQMVQIIKRTPLNTVQDVLTVMQGIDGVLCQAMMG